ncbi:asparagine synthase [Pyrolobus fumarii 1A]|uniref:Asparagine synthase n=1 Tax=Pyrolobus fumarii (strain DSM 11204 / 1A) TaxID=694429 RepID=G0EHC2_PYRF1|nr:asparagine synthase C-terminal domain-containing protein [Pyrolobus fumarii]AEM38497.1 asparagine synthase [Pyrolobus fumarii 1A]
MKLPCDAIGELLLDAVTRFVRSTGCDCIALSGGIDTSFVALAAHLAYAKLRGVTVYYAGGLPRDLYYASFVARRLGIEQEYVMVDYSFIASRAALVLECTRRRDYIELRNDVVFLAAIEWSLEKHCKCLLTGDGGDELLAGYSFLRLLDSRSLREAILRLGVRGRYPSLELAECIGARVEAPLLNDEVVEIVTSAPIECIRGWLLEGKHPLRAILEKYGLWPVATRTKTPAESGAGTDTLSHRTLEVITGLQLDDLHGA